MKQWIDYPVACVQLACLLYGLRSAEQRGVICAYVCTCVHVHVHVHVVVKSLITSTQVRPGAPHSWLHNPHSAKIPANRPASIIFYHPQGVKHCLPELNVDWVFSADIQNNFPLKTMSPLFFLEGVAHALLCSVPHPLFVIMATPLSSLWNHPWPHQCEFCSVFFFSCSPSKLTILSVLTACMYPWRNHWFSYK